MYFCVDILHTVNSNALYINFTVMILVPHLFYLSIDNEKSTRICWWCLSLSWFNPGWQLSPSQPERWGIESEGKSEKSHGWR